MTCGGKEREIVTKRKEQQWLALANIAFHHSRIIIDRLIDFFFIYKLISFMHVALYVHI